MWRQHIPTEVVRYMIEDISRGKFMLQQACSASPRSKSYSSGSAYQMSKRDQRMYQSRYGTTTKWTVYCVLFPSWNWTEFSLHSMSFKLTLTIQTLQYYTEREERLLHCDMSCHRNAPATLTLSFFLSLRSWLLVLLTLKSDFCFCASQPMLTSAIEKLYSITLAFISWFIFNGLLSVTYTSTTEHQVNSPATEFKLVTKP